MILPLTQLVGLFPDRCELVQNLLAEDRDLAGVDHINHTVDHVIQSRILLKARSVCRERGGCAELKDAQNMCHSSKQLACKSALLCIVKILNGRPGSDL